MTVVHKVAGQQNLDGFKNTLISQLKDSSNFSSARKLGFLAEVHTYSYLIYDKLSIGGYYFAGTYKILPKSTIGLGYSYSVYNKSIVLDLRQELSQMRIKPIIFANFGYAFSGNKYTVESSLGFPQEIQAKSNLVYNIGAGSRMYFVKKLPTALNFGLFYKNEPGFELSEGKSGLINIDKYRNIGSICIFLGISI
jgi:hypothetical protein